jgi:hypothetical protein
MKYILLIAWAANGTGFTAQEFDTLFACEQGAKWVQENNYRGGSIRTTCIRKAQEK